MRERRAPAAVLQLAQTGGQRLGVGEVQHLTATDSTVLRLTSDDPDVRLMLDVRDGSAAAFEELMLRYQTRVATVLEHLLGRRAANEDLAQDVFLRVFRARKSYVPAAKFSTWLFTIVNHVALNAMRSKSRRPEVQLPPADSGSHSHSLADLAPAASGQMPTRLVDKSEMREIVRRAVDQLSDRQ